MLSTRVLFGSLLLSSSLVLATASGAEARGYTVLHTFAGAPNDGSFPYNDVVFDDAGNLYSATNLGGASDNGSIFKIAPNGTETVLYSFAGGAQGSDPNAGVTIDPTNGDLYGTTTFGGNVACRNGCGVLYRLAADGTYTVLHSFDNADDGQYPAGQLTRDKLGNIYGIATSGGPGGGGTVFTYTAKGTFNILHAFAGVDGFSPQGKLLRDRAGNLYGVTMQGGADDYGTVYTMASDGSGFSTLYSFTGGNDGGYPVGGVGRDKAGNLYGATNLAGNGATPNGTVFKLATDGTLTTLHVFTGGADGGYPAGDMLESQGKLYGTTAAGGAHADGVAYKIDTATGSEKVLHNFNERRGASPQAGLTRLHDRLYGMASGGGDNNLGVVFSLKK